LGTGFPDDFQGIELENEIGLRVYGWRFEVDGKRQAEIKFVFHHACCDGKGAIGFIEQVISQCQLLLGEIQPDALPCVDSERILDRDRRKAYSFGGLDRIKRALLVRPKRVANMLFKAPIKLCWRPEKTTDLYADPTRQCSTTLDVETTKALGAFAKSQSASTNSIVAAALFQVLDDCLLELDGAPAGKKVLRVMIPFSLRDERHCQMPAANCVSMSYLEMRQSALRRGDAKDTALLADLERQMAFIRKWKIQYSWIESIESYARLWPLIRMVKWFQAKDKPTRQVTTTVMSNLGRVFDQACGAKGDNNVRVGDLEVETVHLVLPCSENQSVNFAVNFYRDRLTLDVSWLPSLVSQDTAESLLDAWRGRILDVVRVS